MKKTVILELIKLILFIIILFVSVISFGYLGLFYLFITTIFFRSILSVYYNFIGKKIKRSLLNGSQEVSFIVIDLLWVFAALIILILIKLQGSSQTILFFDELIALFVWMLTHDIYYKISHKNRKQTINDTLLIFLTLLFGVLFAIKNIELFNLNLHLFLAKGFFYTLLFYDGLRVVQDKKGYLRFVYEIKGKDAIIMGVILMILAVLLLIFT